MAKRKENTINVCEELSKAYDRWNDIYKNGGSDPFWPDGTNLNLVRNHIIYYKKQIEEQIRKEKYPYDYYRELPPEVDSNYIAKREEIIEKAPAILAQYEADENYIWLKDIVNKLTDTQKKNSSIINVLGYCAGLRKAIEENDAITMRRHTRGIYDQSNTYAKSFKECRNKIENMLGNVVNEEMGEEDMARIAELEAQIKELIERNEELQMRLEEKEKENQTNRKETMIKHVKENKKRVVKEGVRVRENDMQDTNNHVFATEIDVLSKLEDIVYEVDRKWLWVTGDTLKHKDKLKQLGMRWSFKRSAWYLIAS